MLYTEALLYGLDINAQKKVTPDNAALIQKAQQWAMGRNVDIKPAYLKPFLWGLTGKKTELLYPAKALGLKQEDIFPKTTQQHTIQSVWTALEKEIGELEKLRLSEEAYSETLFYLLKKHLSQVAVNKELSHLSLFEGVKLRAAIANALHQAPETAKCPLLMFCADLSGIQDFLYNIAKSKAAKSLKGRSFYLQLLINTVVEKIVELGKEKGIGLSWGQIVYASGGKLFMVLPNTQKMKDILNEVERKYIDHLFTHHRNELYVCMEWIEWGYDADMKLWLDNEQPQHIADLWKALIDKTAQKKQQKFKNLLIDKFTDFFDPISEGGDTNEPTQYKVCAVTGEKLPNEALDPKKASNFNLNTDSEKEPVFVTALVKQQTELGSRLKNAKYYWINTEKHAGAADNTLGLDVYRYLEDEVLFKIKDSSVKTINELDFLAKENRPATNTKSGLGFMFYGGNKQPLKNERDEKNYEELTGIESEDDKGKGFTRLGVLRMDVDWLGGLFAGHGEDNSKPSLKTSESCNNLTAYATISAQLDLFFSGYLNTLRNTPNYKDWINILYSGGDDLFIIGRWDLCIEFAELIRSQFKAFIGNTDELSISGGLALVGGKFPISKAAELADVAEKKAKKFNNEAKNAFSFLGETLHWGEEFEFVKTKKEEIVKLLRAKSISQGFIQQLQRYKAVKDEQLQNKQEECTEKDNKIQTKNYSYKWHIAYQIGRSKKQNKDASGPYWEFLSQLQIDLLSYERKYDLYALAARWAELEIRQNGNNQN